MPKETKTYKLFIAAPGDIISEKKSIFALVDEWNRLQGLHKNVRIEVEDWSSAYPIHGSRAQALINEQIFDESDFVVALFWTKFGTPTGVADSGTEEEIERAIEQKKHLMLYFSDAPIEPTRLNAEDYQKVKAFRKKHQDNGMYKMYNSTEQFHEVFQSNLSKFMNDLLAGKLGSKPKDLQSKAIKPEEEKDETGVEYDPIIDIQRKIEQNFPSYWTKLYGIIEPGSIISNSIKISKNNSEDIKKLKEKVADWEKEIKVYSEKLKTVFSEIDSMSADELKNEIMPEELWTVGAALDSFDNELWLFKHHYQEMASFKVKETVGNIIRAMKDYTGILPASVKSGTIKKIESLGLGILRSDQTLLSGVIGKGIRSEILHKLEPAYFPLMTRRSIWALFFFSDQAEEFIVDQTKDGKFRTVHNWDYRYDYFTYYNHIIFELMKKGLAKHKIILQPEFKYGYVNLFLVDIFKSHARDIEDLRKLKHK
jgi:hypothetical protein